VWAAVRNIIIESRGGRRFHVAGGNEVVEMVAADISVSMSCDGAGRGEC